ncbi:hypothetical protein [Streptomyces sp. NPDC055287]
MSMRAGQGRPVKSNAASFCDGNMQVALQTYNEIASLGVGLIGQNCRMSHWRGAARFPDSAGAKSSFCTEREAPRRSPDPSDTREGEFW